MERQKIYGALANVANAKSAWLWQAVGKELVDPDDESLVCASEYSRFFCRLDLEDEIIDWVDAKTNRAEEAFTWTFRK